MISHADFLSMLFSAFLIYTIIVFVIYVVPIILLSIMFVFDSFITTRLEPMIYTIRHKKAFIVTERILFGKNTVHGYLHDLEKVFLYLIFGDVKGVQKWHRQHNKHHVEYWNIRPIEIPDKWKRQMIIDFECARATKPDKPLNWIETIEKFYSKDLNIEEFYKVLPKEKYESLKKYVDNIDI